MARRRATFHQYDNGITEVVFHDASREAVDDYMYFLRLIMDEVAVGDEILLLNDMRRSGPPRPGYHFSELLKFVAEYKHFSASARVVSVYQAITPQIILVLSFIGALNMVQGEFDIKTDYQQSIDWVLQTELDDNDMPSAR
ncbi:MAG: hypothetical protein AAFN11_01865 [Chloroflexota bacterium]